MSEFAVLYLWSLFAVTVFGIVTVCAWASVNETRAKNK